MTHILISSFFLFSAVADVSSFSPSPFLPPLLKFNNGTTVQTPVAWAERRVEIKKLLQDVILGSTPPASASPLLRAELVNQTVAGEDLTCSFWNLVFEVIAGGIRQDTLSFPIEVIAPTKGAGIQKRFPIFMTQWNHREWALAAVARGYVGVIYPGADVRDVAPEWQAAFPNATMALIMARAHVASRALDFLLANASEGTAAGKAAQTRDLNLPALRTDQVAVTGHSRNGKQSLVFAAFDDRVTAVVGSSPGAPIASPFRFTTSNFYGEGPLTGGVVGPHTAGWWIPSVLQYAGHPERMPMDGHGVLGLIAPRHCAVATGHQDEASDMIFADEQNLREVSRVYRLLGVPARLRNIYRYGTHHGFDDVTTYIDWTDHSFQRVTPYAMALAASGQLTADSQLQFPMTWLTPAAFDWGVWNSTASFDRTPPPPSAPLHERVDWLLALRDGNTVPDGQLSARSIGASYGEESHARGGFVAHMLGHSPEGRDLSSVPLSFGDYLSGTAFFPTHAPVLPTHPLPAIVWLHPYSYNTGYTPSYGQSFPHYALASAGAVVLAYDQVGFGIRNTQGGNRFYARHGAHASLLGQMVKDARSAVDVLLCRSTLRHSPRCYDAQGQQPSKIPYVDPDRIFVMGYALGGTVALHVAALDARVAGVASFAGFTPFRTDTADKPTGGLRRLSELHALIPRLGLFVEHPLGVPYDYDELLRAIGSRPALLYTPVGDRDATFEEVQACVDGVKNVMPNLTHVVSNDTRTRMEIPQSICAAEWFKKVAFEIN